MTAPASTSMYNSLQPHLPTDAKDRKRVPLWSGLVKYFPDALVAVAKLSQVANEQHNPGEPVHWSREKSSDHEDTLLRHLFDSGTVDNDGQHHSTKVAWRALALLQLELERSRIAEASVPAEADGGSTVHGIYGPPTATGEALTLIERLITGEGVPTVPPTVLIGGTPIHLNESTLRFVESQEYQDAVEAFAARTRADAYANANHSL